MPEALRHGGRWNPRCKFHYIFKFNKATEGSIKRNFRSLSQRKRLCVALTALPVPSRILNLALRIFDPCTRLVCYSPLGLRVLPKVNRPKFGSVNCVKYGVEAYLESFFFS